MYRLLMVLLFAPLNSLMAQETPTVVPGDQVRIWRAWPSNYWEQGTVVSLDADTLVLTEETYHRTLVIPLDSLEKFEVRRGGGFLRGRWDAVPLHDASSIALGARVRVRRPARPGQTDRWLVGNAVSMSADTLVMRADDSTVSMAIPTSSITELSVGRGKSRDKGAFIGAAIGFAAGNIYHKIINPPEYRCISEREGGDCNTLFFLFADGSTGAPFGALLGALLLAEDHWEPVSLPVHASYSPRDGIRMVLRFEFGS